MKDCAALYRRCWQLLIWLGASGCAVAAPERLLVLTVPNLAIVRNVVETVQQRSRDSVAAGRPALEVDVRIMSRGMALSDLIKQVEPELQLYRAVFATSIGLAREVQKLNRDIPIVFVGEADPVQLCVADSMQRPGRNATGYMDYLPDDDVKMMEALVEGFPAVRTIYMMVADSSYWVPECGPIGRIPAPAKPPCVAGLRRFEQNLEWWQQTSATLEQAKRLGVDVKFMLLCRREDFKTLSRIEPGRSDIGFVFAYQGLYMRNLDELLTQAAQSRRPAIYGRSAFARRGGLMSLEPILDADDDRTAIDMLLSVLDGRSPATLPIQLPRGFRLTFNAATAAAQGLQPSLRLLRRADEVILGAGR